MRRRQSQGPAFADHIKTEKIKHRTYEEDLPLLHMRTFFLPLLMIILGCILFINLFSVQIISGRYYAGLADSNRIRTQIIHAPRGIIFDRNGKPLVYNAPGFRKLENCQTKESSSCKSTYLSKEQALSMIAKGAKNIEVYSMREYPYKEAVSHVVGYIGQISAEELSTEKFADYAGSDWVGKSGIEAEYEGVLKGIDGKELIEVDAFGKKMRSLGQTDPIAGQDVYLTIDIDLQQAVYKAASEVKKGAIVVSKPTGEILAMVSKPSYDPNLFTLDKTYKPATESGYTSVEKILTDGDGQPLLNRPIEGTYPPGSTFKIITSAAGLEDKVIDKNFKMVDTGIIEVGEFSFANWFYTQYGKKEPGEMDVRRALARSNDIFFYKLADMVTMPRLSAMAKLFGVGSTSGIDLGNEAKGILPSQEWKKKNIGEDWYLGDTYHYGIGQGYLLATPLQVNEWGEVIANGGTLYKPHLLRDKPAEVTNKDFLSDETISLVRDGMVQSCSEGGVAYPLFNFKIPDEKARKNKYAVDNKNFIPDASGSAKMVRIPIACKTGTAQHGGEETLPHAWITTFAPAYKPEVVVSVLVDSGGEGSAVAAPIAKKVYEAYFGR